MSDTAMQLKQMIVDRLFITDAPESIGNDEDLRERYDLDSVKLFDLVIGLEEEFGVSFEGDENFDLERFVTVSSILNVLREKGVEVQV